MPRRRVRSTVRTLEHVQWYGTATQYVPYLIPNVLYGTECGTWVRYGTQCSIGVHHGTSCSSTAQQSGTFGVRMCRGFHSLPEIKRL